MHIPRRQRHHTGLNLTPIIDMVFLLIVFFMLSSSFTTEQAFELSVTSSDIGETITEDTTSLHLYVSDPAHIRYKDTTYPRESFSRTLQSFIRRYKSPPPVTLHLTAPLSLQESITIMDTLHTTGITSITLAK